MEKNTTKKNVYGKTALSKALKGRLCVLTQALGEAEVGGKGIDIVKEIKELQVLLEIIQSSTGGTAAQKSADSQPLVVVWGSAPAPEEDPEQVPSQRVEQTVFDVLKCKTHGGQHDTHQ